MKKILFPTDFSENSKNAFNYALDLAKRLGAEIIALHVYQLPVMDYDGIQPQVLETYNVFEAGVFENFKSQMPWFREFADEKGYGQIAISSIMLEGDLTYNIVHLAEKEHCDFIVMATSGSHGFGEVFVGSTAGSVVTNAKSTVLAVPEGFGYRPVRRIGFAHRYHDDDRVALERICHIADIFEAELTAVYVKPAEAELAEVRVADWELVFGSRVNFAVIEKQDVEQGLREFSSEHGLDLLAMLHHRHGFFENLFHRGRVKKMAFHTQIPLLVLHQE